MFKGFYTAASGMLAQQRRTEMLTNNMANSNTPGYKADQSAVRTFPDLLQQTVDTYSQNGKTTKSTIGSLGTGVYMQEAIPTFTQGDITQTDLKTDIALVNINVPGDDNNTAGSIFFNIQDANGETKYTRNGNFTLDGQGYLTTGSGLYVLDENNERIQLPDDNFTVSNEGILTSSTGDAYRLGVSYTADPKSLVKEGDGLFRAEDGQALESAYTAGGVSFQLKQNFLESSNVDASRTMTDMMSAYRSFEANQKILQAYDKSMDKAANEIGKV